MNKYIILLTTGVAYILLGEPAVAENSVCTCPAADIIDTHAQSLPEKIPSACGELSLVSQNGGDLFYADFRSVTIGTSLNSGGGFSCTYLNEISDKTGDAIYATGTNGSMANGTIYKTVRGNWHPSSDTSSCTSVHTYSDCVFAPVSQH